MNKTSITASAMVLATLVSCEKERIGSSTFPECETVELSLDFPGVCNRTRVPLVADETEAESSVASIQIMVFNDNGLELSQTISSTSGSVKVTKGKKKVVAVANYSGNLSGCSTPEAIYATATDLNDNTIGSSSLFVMSGETDVDVDGATQASISLERIAAKFLIRKISVNLNSAFSEGDISIDRIYVDNAVVKANLGGAKTPLAAADFVNQRGGFDSNAVYQTWSAGPYDEWTMATPGTDGYGTKLFSYPNRTPDNDDSRNKTGAFTVRKTRVVVEATLKGKKTFYPFTFNGPIERNHYYEITDLVITGYGVEHPEDPTPSKGDLSVNIIVKPWEQGGSTSVEI